MSSSILTPQSIAKSAMKILDDEFAKTYSTPQVFSLVEITLKDGTVLGPIMLKLEPRDIDTVAEVVRQGHPMVALSNDTESLLIPVADIKYIKTLRVTSKE